MKVHRNGNYSVADVNGKVRTTKLNANQVKRYTERDETQYFDVVTADDEQMHVNTHVY